MILSRIHPNLRNQNDDYEFIDDTPASANFTTWMVIRSTKMIFFCPRPSTIPFPLDAMTLLSYLCLKHCPVHIAFRMAVTPLAAFVVDLHVTSDEEERL